MRKVVQVLAFSILIYWVLSRMIREEAEFQQALAERVEAVENMDDEEVDITEFSLS